MRLFNVHTLQLESFFGKELPRYAILSHRWGPDDEELTFRDVQAKKLDKPGIGTVKLHGCIARAKQDKIDYIWVDTFCINKADDAMELTKAINSMFAWYQAAAVCYVYLYDVPEFEGYLHEPLDKWLRHFRGSSWFRRGWTLQELLAPSLVVFFDRTWFMLGNKRSLSAELEKVTGISAGFLEGVWRLDDASIAQRMSWAAGRITKEPEDVAYSLLGIFGVNMPMIYGEGANAFIRLQEEIAKKSPDDSILAWGMPQSAPAGEKAGAVSFGRSGSIFASSPADFLDSGNIVFNPDAPPMHWSTGSGSLGIEMALSTDKFGLIYGLLHCHAADNSENVVGIPLERLSAQRSNEYVRPAGRPAKFLPLAEVREHEQIVPAALIRIRVSPLAVRNRDQDGSSRFWIKGLASVGLEMIETSPADCWNASNSTVTVPVDDTAWQHIWLRLRKRFGNQDRLDFVLLLSNKPTIQGELRPSSKVDVAVCSRTAHLPRKTYGVAPSLDCGLSNNITTPYTTLKLRQSVQFTGAKSTHVIGLGVSGESLVHYVDLTRDFARMNLEADIIDSLEECDDFLQVRVRNTANNRDHDKHIGTLDSSIKILDRAIARLQRMRSGLAIQRQGALKVQEFRYSEPDEEFDPGEYGYYPPDRYNEVISKILPMMKGGTDDDESRDDTGQTADRVFELIIGHISGGADLKRPAGWTPREIAVYHAACRGKDGPLDFLKQLGGDLEKALVCCVEEGHVQGVETLLAAEASADGPKDGAKRPLILAIVSGNKEIVEMLLDHDASINVFDEKGRSPMEAASVLEYADIEKMLDTHETRRRYEEGLPEQVEKAVDQVCLSLSTDTDVKEEYEGILENLGYLELIDR